MSPMPGSRTADGRDARACPVSVSARRAAARDGGKGRPLPRDTAAPRRSCGRPGGRNGSQRRAGTGRSVCRRHDEPPHPAFCLELIYGATGRAVSRPKPRVSALPSAASRVPTRRPITASIPSGWRKATPGKCCTCIGRSRSAAICVRFCRGRKSVVCVALNYSPESGIAGSRR